jgi:hypothetical protein
VAAKQESAIAGANGAEESILARPAESRLPLDLSFGFCEGSKRNQGKRDEIYQLPQ